MAEIIQLVSGDQALRLYNEQFLRTMAFGAQWGKIRVIVRFCCDATSTINSSGLVVGVCQGTANPFRSSQTDDFIGACLGTAIQTNNWTYNAGPPPYATVGGFLPVAFKRQGSTNTVVPPGGSITIYMPISPTRGIFGVDIEKSNGVMRVKPLGIQTQALAQTDYNSGNFFFNSDNDVSTSPLIGGLPNVLSVPYTGQYAFDTVNIDWNNGIQPLNISDIMVVRFF
jgi:hypothetical protein